MGSTNEPWEGAGPRALLCSCGFTSVPGPIRPPISVQPRFGRMQVWDAAQDHMGIQTGRVQHLALTITTTHSHVLVQKSWLFFFFLCKTCQDMDAASFPTSKWSVCLSAVLPGRSHCARPACPSVTSQLSRGWFHSLQGLRVLQPQH